MVTDMVKDISSVIENEDKMAEVKIEVFDLAKEIKSIIKGLEIQFRKKGIDLSLKTPDKLLINSDKGKLSQSIYNILTNAYKFTNENGKVNVEVFLQKNDFIIEIRDTGIGIKESDLEMIFSPYFRGENAYNENGEGLGLYIAKQNLNNIGGDIVVLRNKNQGSIFRIILKQHLNLKTTYGK